MRDQAGHGFKAVHACLKIHQLDPGVTDRELRKPGTIWPKGNLSLMVTASRNLFTRRQFPETDRTRSRSHHLPIGSKCYIPNPFIEGASELFGARGNVPNLEDIVCSSSG